MREPCASAPRPCATSRSLPSATSRRPSRVDFELHGRRSRVRYGRPGLSSGRAGDSCKLRVEIYRNRNAAIVQKGNRPKSGPCTRRERSRGESDGGHRRGTVKRSCCRCGDGDRLAAVSVARSLLDEITQPAAGGMCLGRSWPGGRAVGRHGDPASGGRGADGLRSRRTVRDGDRRGGGGADRRPPGLQECRGALGVRELSAAHRVADGILHRRV